MQFRITSLCVRLRNVNLKLAWFVLVIAMIPLVIIVLDPGLRVSSAAQRWKARIVDVDERTERTGEWEKCNF